MTTILPQLHTDLYLDIGKVDKCYNLGDMLDADGGCDSTESATCVRSWLIYGRETWSMEVEHELNFNLTAMSMIGWMCGFKLNERKKSEEL